MMYVLEYIQTDPADSPTPGLRHFAGDQTFEHKRPAIKAAKQAIGKPVPPEHFSPCCDWQRADTLVSGCRVLKLEDYGYEPYRAWDF